MNNQFTCKARPSQTSMQDILAHQVKGTLSTPPQASFKIPYNFHLNQKTIGVCTAIELVAEAEREFGIKFSVDFTYWGGKGYDGDLGEGSSNLSMLKYGHNVGFLPADQDPGCNNFEDNYEGFLSRKKNYTAQQLAIASQYKISAYSRVTDLSPQGLAQAIQSSKHGLKIMIQVGDNWYSPSWAKKDIELLRAPNVTGAHSTCLIGNEGLDVNALFDVHNTWGDQANPTAGPGMPIWSDDGDIKFKYSTQIPYIVEAYIVYFQPITFTHQFNFPINYGDTSAEVVALQRILVQHGFLKMPAGVAYGYYGNITAQAVKAFQVSKGITAGDGMNVGPSTRAALNSL